MCTLRRTIRPGRVPGPGNSLQAPHLSVSVFGRGLLKRLATRIYFEGGDGNDEDPILGLVPQDRRLTLTADQQFRIQVLSLLIIPGVVFATGVWTWWKRR